MHLFGYGSIYQILNVEEYACIRNNVKTDDGAYYSYFYQIYLDSKFAIILGIELCTDITFIVWVSIISFPVCISGVIVFIPTVIFMLICMVVMVLTLFH